MDFTNINPHLEPAAVELRVERERNEDRASDNHVQHDVRLALRDLGPKIRDMKKVRDQPGQPGWMGSSLGLELEQAKGLATILCAARSFHKGKRHLLLRPEMPHVVHLPAVPGKRGPTVHHVKDLVDLKRLVNRTVADEQELRAIAATASAPDAAPSGAGNGPPDGAAA